MPLRYLSFLNIFKVVTEGPEKRPLSFRKVENSDLLRGLHCSAIQQWDSDVDARKRRDEKQLLCANTLVNLGEDSSFLWPSAYDRPRNGQHNWLQNTHLLAHLILSLTGLTQLT